MSINKWMVNFEFFTKSKILNFIECIYNRSRRNNELIIFLVIEI